MPFDDLDLEFEDEEEIKKKKSDAVQVDVDLEFHTPEEESEVSRQEIEKKPAPAATRESAKPLTNPGMKNPVGKTGEVRKLDEARAQSQVQKRSVAQGTSPRISGTSALKEEPRFEFESQEVNDLREHVRKVEFNAEVKVAIAEFKTEILSELLGDMKLMEHQIGQLLVRINAKHPDMKQEALMIKKILADFTAKKRK